MKKILSLAFSFAFVFAIAGIAHADSKTEQAVMVCNFPDHAIWNNDNSAKVGCITDTDWKAAVQAQAVANPLTDLIHVNLGQRLLTTFGFEDVCPAWFPLAGCVIKKTLFVKWL